QVLSAALQDAGVEPTEVQYLEAHGTGTSLGDPIEVQAAGAVYCNGRSSDNPLLIGSAKTTLGHLQAVAGLVGMCKAALALEHGAVPPHRHLKEPNPLIPWDELPMTVATSLTPWPEHDGPRRAAV